MDGCEPPCGCWDLNSGLSEEQLVLLAAEPSLQPSTLFKKIYLLFLLTYACVGVGACACNSMRSEKDIVSSGAGVLWIMGLGR